MYGQLRQRGAEPPLELEDAESSLFPHEQAAAAR